MVSRIPRGKVATYGDVARAAGHPGTARQVAWALRDAGAARIPWQRVLGSGGKILLPGEAGLHQKLLLEIEGVQFSGNCALMKHYGHRFPDACLDGTRRKGVKNQGRRAKTRR